MENFDTSGKRSYGTETFSKKKELDMNVVDVTKAHFFSWKEFDSRLDRADCW